MEKDESNAYLHSLIFGILGFLSLYLLGLSNYLLFHSIIEFASISISFTIFLLIWATRKMAGNFSLIYLGTAYLSIGVLGLLHMLAYKGMGIFYTSGSADTATQLWLAGRFVESVSMALLPLVISRSGSFKNNKTVYLLYLSITAFLISAIFLWDIFPASYVEGEGLTPFKKISEYVFCLLFLAAVILLKRERRPVDNRFRRYITLALILSIAAELSFTLYSDVYGLTNASGHYLKLLSYIFIFYALVDLTLRSPQLSFFRKTKMNQQNPSFSESLHSAMVANIPDILGIVDSKGMTIYKSDNLITQFGWNPEELIGKEAWYCVHPEDVPLTQHTFQMLLKDKNTSRTITFRYRHKDGHYSPVELTARNLLDNPDINGILINYHDISGKLESERELQQSEERFRILHNASFGGITIHDKGVILECNQGLTDMTGYKYEELIGMNGLLLIAEKDRNWVMSKILSGYEKSYDVTGVRKDGSTYSARLEARNIPYKGKTVRVVEFRDITREKEAEQEKDKLQEQLLQIQKMESVGRLAGGIAHDFNNMLGVIRGYTEILLEQNPEKESMGYLNEIKKASDRSAELTRQLLAFARKQVVNPEELDINGSVENMIEMLEKMIGSDINLVWEPGKIRGNIYMDPNQLDLILVNLCLNARDSITDNGTVTIATGNRTLTKEECRGRHDLIPGEFLTISVQDSGREIDMEKQAHIFEPFFSDKLESSGMGLPSVYGCVKQNNGFIELKSEKGRGTVFTIHLPLAESGMPSAALSGDRSDSY